MSPDLTGMRWFQVLFWLAAIGLGVAAEWAAFSWDEPRRWLPDLVVGLTFLGCGWAAWTIRGERATGALLAATGGTWFLGNFLPEALYLHRGPLVHLLLTYSGWRPRSRLDAAAVAIGYVVAVATPVWRSDVATIVLALALVAVAGYGYLVASGRARRARLVALQSAAVLGVVLAGGAAARLAVPAGDAVDPALLAYQAVLCGIAVWLLTRLPRLEQAAVADLVVELETRSGTLRERLARALGDPTLELGYWSTEATAYLDDTGAALAIPGPDGDRSATFVEREGARFVVLVHDAAILGDPALVEAVAAATRLAASNVALQEEVRAQLAELTASRRRLLVAADDEGRRLEARLRDGPERRLAGLAEILGRVRSEADDEHVDHARNQLALTLEELHQLARGLHPRELAEAGLPGALAALAERAPVPVQVDVRVEHVPDEIAATVYFVCAEALANVAKYASAARATIDVAPRNGRLRVEIADDGVGGADSSRGTGLQGLADRVQALGGSLELTSPQRGGTRLAAEIPLRDEAR
jgi:signal transduction histidine kinase